MGHARLFELCMDTSHKDSRLAEFWASTIGGRFDKTSGDVVADPGPGIAMCLVPEPRTVKHRVHLDVYAAAISDLEALGATVLLPATESGFRWTVMADPGGGEFCAFLKDPLPAYRLHGVVVDCADPERVARWWGERLGVPADDNNGGGWWTLNGATADPVLTIDFVSVPEPKTVKNRIHWDVYGDPAEFLDAGATPLWDMPKWRVLADPEGNEFCVDPEPST
jgi:hypothetical protein